MPKTSLDLETLLLKELQSSITLETEGASHSLSKKEALIKQLVTMAIEGKPTALGLLLKLTESLASTEPEPSEDDERILNDYVSRLHGKKSHAS